jgi:release factor glutamine methyltransferase
MTLKEVLDKTVVFFKEKKIDTPRLDAEILFTHALNFKNRVDLYLKYDQLMSDAEIGKCREFVRRRSQGEPVAYILGKKDFYGISFQVSPAVLIPRPETELLVEEAESWIKNSSLKSPVILDLGSGSGCIGLTLLKRIPDASLVAVDKSADSLEVAKHNAENLKLSDRVQFMNSDVCDLNMDKKFDLILANPPYISEADLEVSDDVKKFEPAMALFSQEDGFQALKSWSKKSIDWLKPSGFMGFEMGYSQGQAMKNYFETFSAFSKVKVVKDLSGLDRHVIGVRGG